jgi:hypothetical protein
MLLCSLLLLSFALKALPDKKGIAEYKVFLPTSRTILLGKALPDKKGIAEYKVFLPTSRNILIGTSIAPFGNFIALKIGAKGPGVEDVRASKQRQSQILSLVVEDIYSQLLSGRPSACGRPRSLLLFKTWMFAHFVSDGG